MVIVVTLIITNFFFVILFFKEWKQKYKIKKELQQLRKKELIQRSIVKICLDMMKEKEYLISDSSFSTKEISVIELLRYLRDADLIYELEEKKLSENKGRFPRSVYLELLKVEEMLSRG
ncbi:hypothetical protein ACI3E5_04475 [Candidatus Enterococcus avicola]